MIELFQISGVLLGITGNIICAIPAYRAKIIAFWFWIVANSLMFCFSKITGDFWYSLLFAVYAILAGFGVIWDRGKRHEILKESAGRIAEAEERFRNAMGEYETEETVDEILGEGLNENRSS